MFRVILLFISIVLFDIAISAVTKMSFGKTMPTVFALLFIIQYTASLTGMLSNWKYLYVVCVLIGIIIILYKYKNTLLKYTRKLILSPSFIIFSFLFFFLYWIQSKNCFTCTDEFVYWGEKVKEAIGCNQLYTSSNEIKYGTSSYPPLITVLQIFICKFLGGYSEQSCLFASSLFATTFIIPVFDKKRNSTISITVILVYSLITCLTISTSFMLCNSFLFNSIYVDWPLGIVYAYLMYLAFEYENKSDLYYVCVIMSCFLLIKQVAIPLALCPMTYIVVKALIKRNVKFIDLCIIVLVPWLVYVLWQIDLSKYVKEASATIYIVNIAKASVFEKISSDYGLNIIRKFLKYAFTKPLITHPIGVPYFEFILIVTFVIYVVGKSKKNLFIKLLALFFFIGALGYSIVILYSYIMIFTTNSGPKLTEFARYMQTYTFSGFFLLYYLFTNLFTNIKQEVVVVMLTVFFVEPISINTLVPNKNKETYNHVNQALVEEYVEDIIKDDKVLCIAQNDHMEFVFVSYLFSNRQNNVSWIQYYDNDTKEKFIEDAKNYDYIYMGIYDLHFKEEIWSKTTDSELYNESLYKVLIDGDNVNIELERIFTER